MLKSNVLLLLTNLLPSAYCFLSYIPNRKLQAPWKHLHLEQIDSLSAPPCAVAPESTTLHTEVTQFLADNEISFQTIHFHNTPIVALGNKSNHSNKFQIGLHLLPFPYAFPGTSDKVLSPTMNHMVNPKLCKTLTDETHSSPFETIIHLHEDVWCNKNEIVKARILAKMNIVKKRWYARNTIVERINVKDAMEFLEEHHLWQSTKAKYNYGLFEKRKVGDNTHEKMKGELLAVATFSPRRHVKRLGSDYDHDKNNDSCGMRLYRSHELIRYCAKKDEVVLGGITKLLARFCQELAPDDIVTCIDRDFGNGDGWGGIGFERVQVMPPLLMAIHKNRSHGNYSNLERRYLVGAGVGLSKKDCTCDRQNINPTSTTSSFSRNLSSRQGIDEDTFSELSQAANAEEGMNILIRNNYWPVYDAGVERRMLVVQKSKMKNHSESKMKDLGLNGIITSNNSSVLDLWNGSTPSFPDSYYSSNEGIEFLLKRAASK